MTCKTSAAAVCCSSASRVSVKSRVFSIAMTAWSAKVQTSSIWRSVNGSTRPRSSTKTPIGSPSRNSGTPSTVWTFAMATASGCPCSGSLATSATRFMMRPLLIDCLEHVGFRNLLQGGAGRLPCLAYRHRASRRCSFAPARSGQGQLRPKPRQNRSAEVRRLRPFAPSAPWGSTPIGRS